MMVYRTERRRGVAALILLIALVSCDSPLDVITDSERATNVAATDGDFGDRIEITWTAPDTSEENAETQENEVSLVGYDVIRSDSFNGSVTLTNDLLSADRRSYVDRSSGLRRGVLYEYTVRAVFSDGTAGVSRPDTGYAISAGDIQLGSDFSRYGREYDTTAVPAIANGTVWFQFPAQQGWRYEILTVSADSSNVVTDIRLLSEDDLEATAKVASTAGSIFTAQRSGLHYVELSGGAGTVAVRYLGVE